MRISPSCYYTSLLRSFVSFSVFFFFFIYRTLLVSCRYGQKAEYSCRIVSVYKFICSYTRNLRLRRSRVREKKAVCAFYDFPERKRKDLRLIPVRYVRNGRYIDMYVYIHINTVVCTS